MSREPDPYEEGVRMGWALAFAYLGIPPEPEPSEYSENQ